jgi:hypothetical protein
VKEGNVPSRKVFEALGFTLHSSNAGVFEYFCEFQ